MFVIFGGVILFVVFLVSLLVVILGYGYVSSSIECSGVGNNKIFFVVFLLCR